MDKPQQYTEYMFQQSRIVFSRFIAEFMVSGGGEKLWNEYLAKNKIDLPAILKIHLCAENHPHPPTVFCKVSNPLVRGKPGVRRRGVLTSA